MKALEYLGGNFQ